MRTFAIDMTSCPEELRPGLHEIQADRADRFGTGESVVALRFAREDDSAARHLSVASTDGVLTVRYARMTDAFRALGRLLGEDGDAVEFSETAKLDMLGVMVDVSRNGVLRPDAAKALIRHYIGAGD